MTEFWAAIAGAIVGGLIALCIQLVALRAAKREREAEAAVRTSTLAYSLLFKVHKLHSGMEKIRQKIEEDLARAVEAFGDKGELWMGIYPVEVPPEPVHLSADELALVLKVDEGLTNRLLRLESLHNSMLTLLSIYARERAVFSRRWLTAVFDEADGVISAKRELDLLKPEEKFLRRITESIVLKSGDFAKDLNDVAMELTAFLQKVGIGAHLARAPESGDTAEDAN